MDKVQLVIELDRKDYEELNTFYILGLGTEEYRKIIEKHCTDAIRQGKPCNSTEDCISRKALQEEFKRIYRCAETTEQLANTMEEAIDNAPTVKHSLLPLASEADGAYMRGFEAGKVEGFIKGMAYRPKGRWVYEKDTVNSVFRCSNCGRFYTHDVFVKEDDDRYTRLEREDANRFCWHCGADMRGDTECN